MRIVGVLILNAVLAGACPARAQPPADAPPAAAPAPVATPSLAADHAKYKAARTVYDRIARAWGTARPAPRLIVRPAADPGGPRIAVFRPDTTSIEIDEAVIDLFDGPGRDDALAVLLGHELAHAYRDHGWVGDFGAKFADLDASKTMKAAGGYDRLIKNETEADYFGIFFAHVAGYDALGAAPAVFDKVYEHFKLSDKLGGYPAREDRKKIAAKRADELRDLAMLFDAARSLLLLEQHEAAAAIYDRLAREFPSREIMNNAGAARLMRALASIALMKVEDPANPPAWSLAHPVVLEMASRLGEGRGSPVRSKGPEGDDAVLRLLTEAGDWFGKALAADPAYIPAMINLALVQSLKGEHESASALAGRAIKAAGDQPESERAAILALAQTARAIGLYGQAQSARSAGDDHQPLAAQARSLFEKAGPSCSAAAVNAAILAGTPRPPMAPLPSAPAVREKLGGLDFRAADDVEETHDRAIAVPAPGGDMRVLTRTASGVRASLVTWKDAAGEQSALLVWTTSPAPKTSKGLAVGSTRADVIAALGQPSRMVEGSRGVYEVFPASALIFEFDRAGRVAGWGIYGVRAE